MKIKFIALIILLLFMPYQSMAITKGDYAKLFCKELGIKTDPNSVGYFYDVKKSGDKRAPYISAMGTAFPHGEWTGKQWLAHPDEDLTREMILKSWTIYSGIPLIAPQEARAIVNKKIKNYKNIGFSDDMFLYIGTLLFKGLSEQHVISNEKMDKQSATNLLKKT